MPAAKAGNFARLRGRETRKLRLEYPAGFVAARLDCDPEATPMNILAAVEFKPTAATKTNPDASTQPIPGLGRCCLTEGLHAGRPVGGEAV
jgi:hypothetical protein